MSRVAMLATATLLLAAYPLLVWIGLARLGAPALLGLLLVLLGIRIAATSRGRMRRAGLVAGPLLALAGLAAAFSGIGDDVMLRWYPVLASLFACSIFTASLFSRMPLIERIARLRQPSLPADGVIYTRRLTMAWAVLIFANTLVAAWTARFASLETWALYNGLLSYLLLGGFFIAEWFYRRHRFQEA